MRVRQWLGACLGTAASFGLVADVWAQGGPYVNFETIPTRSLAISPDGARLFVTNTPDGRLEIFNVGANGALTAAGSVSVGLDPVAVSPRNNNEVWVVNHLSDSVSVVDVSTTPARVTRTLYVGDEPRDVVFAGPGGNRAFVTAARRGQNHPDDTVNETQRPGLGRADVWVFDATNLGTAPGGNPLSIVTLFADKPGAMTVSEDGRTVFVSIFTSGNKTSVINDSAVCDANDRAGQGGSELSAQNDGPCRLPNGGTSPGGVPGPNVNQVDGRANPRTGVIVENNPATGAWLDAANRDWRDAVKFTLPDNDVFAIDAMANPPRQSAVFQAVGTLNKSLAVNPASGKLFVATIEAINQNRFISLPTMGLVPNPNRVGGAAATADPLTGRTLNGHLYESRIAILEPGRPVVSRHLNKHINYEVVPSPPGVKERSISDPQGLAFSPDGSTLFVAGLGSNEIVPFQTAQLENDTFVPTASTHIALSGDGGPTDMVFDASGTRMFVYRRFDNAISTIDVAARREVAVTSLFSPEPAQVRVGRKFFYDARLGSSNGEANCNVCHPGADKDDLAWDLGTPFLGTTPNRNPFVSGLRLGNPVFNPIKGPMTVLTLRGIKDTGPMFWRGDITSATPTNERANFQGINVVFPALLGREAPLPQTDFDRLTDWALTIVPPPNPHRALDGRLNASQQEGMAVFLGQRGANDGPFNCNSCHNINPGQAFFGTRGENSEEGESQEFKVTQLRTTYDKIGMFSQNDGTNGDPRTLGGARGRNIGPQIRGTGTLHDGSQGGPEDFLTDPQFQLTAAELRQVVDFVYAFPSNLAPIVGQQVTLRSDSNPATTTRLNLLMQRASTPFVLQGAAGATECDLVAKGVIGGVQRGFLFTPAQGGFMDDAGARITTDALLALARTPGQELTFTCIYPGGGRRFGIDRNLDGRLDNVGVQPQPPVMQPPVVQPPVVQPPVMQPPVVQPPVVQPPVVQPPVENAFIRFLRRLFGPRTGRTFGGGFGGFFN